RSRRMPALFTSTSRPPKVSTAVLMSFWAPSQLEMSSPLATASPPMPLISSTTSCAAQVVHDHLGAGLGEGQRVGSSDASTGTGHDHYTSVIDSHGPEVRRDHRE